MGFDFQLYGHDEYDDARWFRLNSFAWEYVCRLGLAFGWKPEGTEYGYTLCNATEAEIEVLAKTWEGSYTLNEGQIVRESDAAQLGAPLGEALKFVPTERLEISERAPNLTKAFCMFSAEGRECLEKFIAFVQRGAFVIF